MSANKEIVKIVALNLLSLLYGLLKGVIPFFADEMAEDM
jgi:hypothetical protein